MRTPRAVLDHAVVASQAHPAALLVINMLALLVVGPPTRQMPLVLVALAVIPLAAMATVAAIIVWAQFAGTRRKGT